MNNVVLEPPLYFANDHIFDLCFHPTSDFITASIITGEVKILSYNSEDVKEMANLTHHQESCRQSLFADDGSIMATVSKDKSYAIVDQNGKVQIHVKDAHKESINCEYFLNNETLATGDDNGAVKIWDLRNPNKSIFGVGDQNETVTDMVSTNNNHYLLTSALDGTLAVYDLRKANNDDAKLYALSDGMEEDLLSVTLIKDQKFVACSTSEGAILLFKWDYFGDFKDRIIGHPNSVDAMIKYDENTLITGSEDGFARAVSVYPNDIIATLGQHEEDEQFPIQKISMSHCKNFLASCSHDSSIKFYDISYLKDMRQKKIHEAFYGSDSDSEDMEEEKNNEKKQEQRKKRTIEKEKKHALAKKKQLEDQFSDDSDDEDGEGDSEDMEDDSDDDSDMEDDSDEIQSKKQKKQNKKRVMPKGKSNLKKRDTEIKRNKRAEFFDNV